MVKNAKRSHRRLRAAGGGNGQVGLAHPRHGAPGGDAGLRSGEIIALEWTDIDVHRGQFHIRQAEWRGHVTVPKGGRDRRVPMTKRLAALLAGQPAPERCAGDLPRQWDASSQGHRLAVDEAGTESDRAAGHRGAAHPPAHLLLTVGDVRRSRQGHPGVGGPENLTTTQRYMHLSPATKDATIGLLDASGPHAHGDMLETGSAGKARTEG
jgi:integrase